MYRECRFVKVSGVKCDLPALQDSNWCYFHSQLQERRTFRHNRRGPDGRFATVPAPSRQVGQPETDTETIDYGAYPVGAATRQAAPSASLQTPDNATLDLPSLEDPVSIQLALMDVAQALAANRIDAKRAGLLLYALQVASANTRHMHFSRLNAIRSITYDEAGLPLAPERQGRDTEDINEEIRRQKKTDAGVSASSFAQMLLAAKG
jgi:hypothetical protein